MPNFQKLTVCAVLPMNILMMGPTGTGKVEYSTVISNKEVKNEEKT